MLAVVPAGAGELMQVSWRAFAGLPVCLRSGLQVQMCRCVCRCKLFAAVHIVQVCKLLVCWHWCAGDSADVQVQVSILLICSCAYCGDVQMCKLLVCWHLCAGDSAHCRFMELAAELPWEAGASAF